MEELKLILETVQGLGVETKWVVITWLLVAKLISPLIGAAAGLTVAVFTYKLIHKAMAGYQFGHRVIQLFGGWMGCDSDKTAVLRWLEKQELPKV